MMNKSFEYIRSLGFRLRWPPYLSAAPWRLLCAVREAASGEPEERGR